MFQNFEIKTFRNSRRGALDEEDLRRTKIRTLSADVLIALCLLDKPSAAWYFHFVLIISIYSIFFINNITIHKLTLTFDSKSVFNLWPTHELSILQSCNI